MIASKGRSHSVQYGSGSDRIQVREDSRLRPVCYFLDEQVKPTVWRYALIPASGGRPVRQFDFPAFQYQWVRWTPDGRHLSYIGAPPDPSNIWLQPADGGEPRKLTDFKTDYIYRHAWSRDGKTLTLARGRPKFDVALLKDRRQ